MQCTYRNDIVVGMCNCCWCGKQIYSLFSECVFVDLSNQHPNRMRCIILSCIRYVILAYFSTLFHKRYFFRKDLLKKNVLFEFIYNFVL